MWDDEEKQNLLETCVTKVLSAGCYKSGKTSLVRCLHKGKKYITKDDDRTIVVNYHAWPYSERNTIQIFDIGGHSSYVYSAHFFFDNKENNIVLLVHDITLIEDKDYKVTFRWLEDTCTHSPSCQILFVLTKIDKLESSCVLERKEIFAKRMIDSIEKELKSLDMNKKCKNVKMMKIKFLELKVKLEKREIYIVSCKQNIGVDILRKKIMLTGEKTVIEKRYIVFYQMYGMLGLNKDKQDQNETRDPNLRELYESQTPVVSDVKPKAKQVPPKNTEIDLEQESHNSNADLLSFGFESDEEISCADWYTETEQALERYSMLTRKEVDVKLKNDFENCLTCLHSLGLLFWFKKVPSLRKFIFNDLNYFILLIQSVFNHNIENDIDFNSLTWKQRKEMKFDKKKFAAQISKLKTSGKLSKDLLKVFLAKHNFQNISDEIADLFIKLNILTGIPGTEDYFMPWYTDGKEQPPHISTAILEANKFSTENRLAIRTVFEGYIPKTLFFHLCLSLHDNFKKSDLISIWDKNMWVQARKLNVHLEHTDESFVHMITNSDVSGTGESLKALWCCIEHMYQKSLEYQETVWPGFVNSVYFKCPHCILRPVDGNIAEYSVGEQSKINASEAQYTICDKDVSEELPHAMLHPISKGTGLLIIVLHLSNDKK